MTPSRAERTVSHCSGPKRWPDSVARRPGGHGGGHGGKGGVRGAAVMTRAGLGSRGEAEREARERTKRKRGGALKAATPQAASCSCGRRPREVRSERRRARRPDTCGALCVALRGGELGCGGEKRHNTRRHNGVRARRKQASSRLAVELGEEVDDEVEAVGACLVKPRVNLRPAARRDVLRPHLRGGVLRRSGARAEERRGAGVRTGVRRVFERTWSKIGKRILSNTLAQKLWEKLSPWNLSVSNSTCCSNRTGRRSVRTCPRQSRRGAASA